MMQSLEVTDNIYVRKHTGGHLSAFTQHHQVAGCRLNLKGTPYKTIKYFIDHVIALETNSPYITPV